MKQIDEGAIIPPGFSYTHSPNVRCTAYHGRIGSTWVAVLRAPWHLSLTLEWRGRWRWCSSYPWGVLR